MNELTCTFFSFFLISHINPLQEVTSACFSYYMPVLSLPFHAGSVRVGFNKQKSGIEYIEKDWVRPKVRHWRLNSSNLGHGPNSNWQRFITQLMKDPSKQNHVLTRVY